MPSYFGAPLFRCLLILAFSYLVTFILAPSYCGAALFRCLVIEVSPYLGHLLFQYSLSSVRHYISAPLILVPSYLSALIVVPSYFCALLFRCPLISVPLFSDAL